MLRLHHVGHVTKNLDETIKLYKDVLGLTPSLSGIMKPMPSKSRAAFFTISDSQQIEAVEPSGMEGDPPSICLKERGEGLFHLCFYVDDLEKKIKALREKGFIVEEHMTKSSEESTETPLKVAFLRPNQTRGLWIELIDVKEAPTLF